MNRNLMVSLQRERQKGIEQGITSFSRVLIVAMYNAAMHVIPDVPDKVVGEMYSRTIAETLEILRQGTSDTFVEEVDAAIEKAERLMDVDTTKLGEMRSVK